MTAILMSSYSEPEPLAEPVGEADGPAEELPQAEIPAIRAPARNKGISFFITLSSF